MRNLIIKYLQKLQTFGNSVKHINALAHSYSQSGEDIIVKRILGRLNFEKKQYIDIGCNHPINLNNTYLLYKSGYKGTLVDANPFLHTLIKAKRRKDNFINCGIDGTSKKDMLFYVLSESSLSTYDEKVVEKLVTNSKIKIIKEISIPIVGINEFLLKHYTTDIKFVSIDVEGYDTAIIKNWDFSKYKPSVFCIETISHLAQNKIQHKANDILNILNNNGYLSFADTYINTIFVDSNLWYNRT